MKPARGPSRRSTKLLLLTRSTLAADRVSNLAEYTHPGDVWVVNDAATFPASLSGTTARGEPIELRLLRRAESGPWSAITFGAGDWRTKTEERPRPPPLRPGDEIFFGEDRIRVSEISPRTSRLITCDFARNDFEIWEFIYRFGTPIQYSYLEEPLELWSVQTAYAGRPWASEMPSAGFPLTWTLIREIKSRGGHVHTLTHSTGLSSTGDPILDSLLPFPEHYEIPEKTVSAIQAAKARGSRVIAVGTSVMRALEGSAQSESGLRAGRGETPLRIDGDYSRRIVDGILSGLHSPGESHFELLRSFTSKSRLEEATNFANALEMCSHEFGDVALVIA